jgi:hypothetical protein
MNQEEVEKAIKEVLKDGESYDISEIHSYIFHDAPHLRKCGGSLRALLRSMSMANVIGEEQVTKYFLTEEKSNVK